MFINLQVGLLSPEKLVNYAVLAAGLSNRWEISVWIKQAVGTVFGGLISAAANDALSEKHLAEVKTSLVIAAIGGLVWALVPGSTIGISGARWMRP